MEQSEVNYLKTELVNDLVATTTIMEDLWRYHPENPDKKDVVSEYKVLERIKLESNTATDRFSTVMEHRTPLVNRILPRLDS